MSDELPDIEIGRYALRTFDTSKGKLGSLYKAHSWEGGVAVAECKQVEHPCDPASIPGDDCSCGLYGTLTLRQLDHDYGAKARNCVAVIAAEGPTIIGDKGLRTSAARIVAYWCAEDDFAKVFGRECPDARHFAEIPEMLEAYHFPPYPEFGEQARREQERREYREQMLRSLSGPTYPRRSSWENIVPLLPAASPGGLAAIKGLVGMTS